MFNISRLNTSIVLIVSLLLLSLSVACGASNSLVGKWQHLPNPTPTPPPTSTPSGNALGDMLGGIFEGLSTLPCDLGYPDAIEFFKDGTVDWGGLSGKYEKIENGRLKIEIVGSLVYVYEFSIAGNMLILRDDSRCEIKYQRVSR